MNEHSKRLQYDPNRLLDTLMKRLELDTDEALSHTLLLSMEAVGDIRSGRVVVGASMLLWFSDLTELSTDELRRILGDRRAKARMTCYLSAPSGVNAAAGPGILRPGLEPGFWD